MNKDRKGAFFGWKPWRLLAEIAVRRRPADQSPLTDRLSSPARTQHNTRWCSVSHME